MFLPQGFFILISITVHMCDVSLVDFIVHLCIEKQNVEKKRRNCRKKHFGLITIVSEHPNAKCLQEQLGCAFVMSIFMIHNWNKM